MSLASAGLQYTMRRRARRGTGDALCLGAPDEKQRRPLLLALASAGARRARAARVKDMLHVACVGVLALALSLAVALLHIPIARCNAHACTLDSLAWRASHS